MITKTKIEHLEAENQKLREAFLKEKEERRKLSVYSKADLLNQNETLRKQLDKLEDKKKVISDIIISTLKVLPEADTSAIIKNDKFESEDAGLIISDSQIGQGFKVRDVSGLGAYNFSVFNKRFDKMIEAIQSIHNRHTKAYNIDCLHIFMLGDIVEGEDIFTGQGFFLDMNAFEQIIKGCRSVTAGIWKLAHIFPKIRVYCVPGNHGRPQQKKGKNYTLSNWDCIFYEMMKRDLEKSKNVEVFNSNSSVMATKIQNHTFVMSHGDEVKSYMSVPFYGLDRMIFKKLSLFNSLDYYLCAHHHRFYNSDVNFSEALMNGSFPGWSDFSVNKMSLASIPCQVFFGIHPSQGITYRYKIRLEKKPVFKTDKHNILTPHDEV